MRQLAYLTGGVGIAGDPNSYELRSALAVHHGVDISNILVGEGIDGLLAYTAHLLIAPGDPVVSTHGTYPTLNHFIRGRGGVIHTVPYGRDDRHDLDALVAKAWEVDAKALYLVNPDNPSGTWHHASRVEASCLEPPWLTHHNMGLA